jgi:hypothetical protein
VTEAASGFEGLLREALAPVEPPADLALRLEEGLRSIAELAAEELEEWELATMRDPRNWARPVAAVLAGGAAGTALVVLGARRRAQRHGQATSLRSQAAPARLVDAALGAGGRALRDVRREAQRRLGVG